MSASGRLTPFALVLATASMLVASYAVLSRPAPTSAGACQCDTEALQAEITSLRHRVEVAERNAVRGTVRRVADAAMEPERPAPAEAMEGPGPEAGSGDDGSEPAPTTPRFVDFSVPEPGVEVTQSENGSLSVRNTDPALVGKVVIVQARGEDGQLRDLPITVPPPT